MAPPTSGTYGFYLSGSDMLVECFERIQIGAAELRPDHIFSFRRSVNLELQDWANRGVNLWTVQQYTLTLPQGTSTYDLPAEVVNTLDVFLRTYDGAAPVNLAPVFQTVLNSNQVVCNFAADPGATLNIGVPVSIGGLVLSGNYTVTANDASGKAIITAPSLATATVTGGQVPSFATTAGSNIVTVTLNNHGYLVGQVFPVQVTTAVGGMTLLGNYIIQSVIDANTFTILAPSNASTNDSESENGGATQFATVIPTDVMLYPLSRDDYAMVPNKQEQGRPTTYWFNRVISPQITLWQVPDQNGPYELVYFAMRQVQDFNPTLGQAPEVPNRLIEALCAGVTLRLSEKFRPDQYVLKKQIAQEAWDWAATEDREKAPTYIAPDMSGYF